MYCCCSFIQPNPYWNKNARHLFNVEAYSKGIKANDLENLKTTKDAFLVGFKALFQIIAKCLPTSTEPCTIQVSYFQGRSSCNHFYTQRYDNLSHLSHQCWSVWFKLELREFMLFLTTFWSVNSPITPIHQRTREIRFVAIFLANGTSDLASSSFSVLY